MIRRATILGQRSRRAGFSLLEGIIALTVFGLVAANVSMLMRTAGRAYGSDAASARLESLAAQTMDRIVLSLAGADASSLSPSVSAPFWQSEISFESSLGIEDGEVVYGDPEQIALDANKGEVLWRKNPGLAQELRVVWGKLVDEMQKGELPNYLDDNGNALVDEAGLAFSVDGDMVTICLTLQRTGESGTPQRCEMTTSVQCRN